MMVIVFSALLMVGIILGQVLDLVLVQGALGFVTAVCLAYIMMDVGIEFSTEKRSIQSYGWDFATATSAAVLPALLWVGYFILVVKSDWQPALLSGLSSAPTSAGILFSMLAAAGLGASWVFKKARVLAVLDDLVTVLLLTPLEIILHGFEWKAITSIAIICTLLILAFRFQNVIRLPSGKVWMLLYAIVLTAVVIAVREGLHIHFDVLIPAFVFGCLMRISNKDHLLDESKAMAFLDAAIKGAFMLLVGLTFPKIVTGTVSWGQTAVHVLALTVLANLGKLFLVFCYKDEASFKERMALGVAMFPRGEVGAAVLLIGIGYGLGGYDNTLAVLSLAFNLILTGVFIWIVMRLLKNQQCN